MTTVRLFAQTGGWTDVALVPPTIGSSRNFVTITTTEPVYISSVEEEILGFTFPFAPRDITIEGLSDEYAQLDRPGRSPLVRFAKRRPVTVGITVLVTSSTSKGVLSAEENIAQLSLIAQSKVDLIVSGLGPIITSLRYRITEMSVTVNRMTTDHRIAAANVSLTLVETISAAAPVPGMIKIADVVTQVNPTQKRPTNKKKDKRTEPSDKNDPRSKWPELRDKALNPYGRIKGGI